jgi:hypothetical protein
MGANNSNEYKCASCENEYSSSMFPDGFRDNEPESFCQICLDKEGVYHPDGEERNAESLAPEECSTEGCENLGSYFTKKCLKCGYRNDAESYADFFTQMEDLLESTAGGDWTLEATTDPKDLDSVEMTVKFTPTDPSTFFDIIE